MQFVAKAKFIRYSPYKLRPWADTIRGKNVQYALDWLQASRNQRTVDLRKAVASAAANAYNLHNLSAKDLIIKDLRIDQGPIFRYFKPGAMGRAVVLRKRFSHINVIVESQNKEV